MQAGRKELKRLAIEAGFDLAGVARAGALSEAHDRLLEWLGRGNHAEMAWMAREPEKRSDPRLLFPGAKTVLSVALNYYTPHTHSAAPDAGKISRYAWGDDYHEVLKDKLITLLDRIKAEFPGADGKACVDTAPVLEKAWAAAAGLGWIGKHTNLITRELGSWVFLGELILDIEADSYDERAEDHCGTCTACIDACPTGAITEPYVVDSNLCISYATIEHRGDEFPESVADRLDDWLYGCDICQEVCPWNRFEQPTAEKRFEPRKNETALPFNEILAMTPESYAERFRGSAIKRAKLPGLKRNAMQLNKDKEKDELEK
ncbi:MAG: tRNA epoxyqueuosine(34) reductase QueG [Acidobacteria bacterium]|nr:tRNA epoxyqueuosine(34) reductase QueG [Acidobacteriota bacterium]